MTFMSGLIKDQSGVLLRILISSGHFDFITHFDTYNPSMVYLISIPLF